MPVPNTSPGVRPSPALARCVICWRGVQWSSLRFDCEQMCSFPLRKMLHWRFMFHVAADESGDVRWGSGFGC